MAKMQYVQYPEAAAYLAKYPLMARVATIAKLSGLTPRHIHLLRTGERRASLLVAARLAGLVGCDLAKLLECWDYEPTSAEVLRPVQAATLDGAISMAQGSKMLEKARDWRMGGSPDRGEDLLKTFVLSSLEGIERPVRTDERMLLFDSHIEALRCITDVTKGDQVRARSETHRVALARLLDDLGGQGVDIRRLRALYLKNCADIDHVAGDDKAAVAAVRCIRQALVDLDMDLPSDLVCYFEARRVELLCLAQLHAVEEVGSQGKKLMKQMKAYATDVPAWLSGMIWEGRARANALIGSRECEEDLAQAEEQFGRSDTENSHGYERFKVSVYVSCPS